MKIKLLCEGQTEEGLRKLLAKAIDVQGCGIEIKPYEGVGTLLRKLDGRIKSEVLSGTQALFCLVDYHHFPLPNEKKHLPFQQRLEAIKSNVLEQIEASHRSIVRCHVVAHEVEAWILADDQVLAQRLKSSLVPWNQPENVNDVRPPAKVIEELFRTRLKRRYDKYKDGVSMLQKIDWQKVYAKCPTFKHLVDDLRNCCKQ